MEDVFAILFFLLILAGSALEAYWKSKKKKQQQPQRDAQPRRPARAAKAGRTAPSTRTRAAPGPEPEEAFAGARGVGVPEELLEWLERGRVPQPAPPEAQTTSWDAGKTAEQEAAAEAGAVSLERVPARPRPRHEGREVGRRAAERTLGAPVDARALFPPAEVKRRRRGDPLPRLERLSTVQRAFVWAEILGRPLGDRETGATTPPGLLD